MSANNSKPEIGKHKLGKWIVEVSEVQTRKGSMAKGLVYVENQGKGQYEGRTFKNSDVTQFDDLDDYLAAHQLLVRLMKGEDCRPEPDAKKEPAADEFAPDASFDDDAPPW